MNEFIAINDINQTLVSKAYPQVTLWNRLEPRPRTDNFDRALKAEVRDSLWMLSRQWQMGEFTGNDAGSPALSKIHMGVTELTNFAAPTGATSPFSQEIPLEAKVEKRPIPFELGTVKISLDIRLLMGRQWLKMIKGLGDFKSSYVTKYFISNAEANNKADALITAHSESWQQHEAVAERLMDGGAFYLKLKSDPTSKASEGISATDAQKQNLDLQGDKFIKWFERVFLQDENKDENCWKSSFLEYQFNCSATEDGKEKVYCADEYYHGHLDWYNLDIDPSKKAIAENPNEEKISTETSITRSFIPTPISFDGMPNTRWWTFEDGRTNFGNINPSTNELGKLLFMEFAFVYANDWFLLPFTLDAGSIVKIKGMTVRNVFGEDFWIDQAGEGLDDDWNKWSMFSVNTKGNLGEQADRSLLILPTTSKIQEGDPLEEINLIRDEMSNMVWGIESTVPLITGKSLKGSQAATEYRSRLEKILESAVSSGSLPEIKPIYNAPIRYELMNSVAENWIPFVPVHADSGNRNIKLQRAAMPRILKIDTGFFEKVRPRTTLLSEGLKDKKAYFINEEEVPRAGVSVYQSFQRTRWYDGKVVTWLGIRKHTGRGEGSSHLAFDQIRKVPEGNNAK